MKFIRTLSIALLATLNAAQAHEYDKAHIKVDHPWARPTLTSTVPGAAYLIIENTSDLGDRLLSARVGEDIAATVELHRTVEIDGVSRMRPQPRGMVLPPKGELRFEPTGLHIMLIGLEERLELGQQFPLTLVFERAGPVEVIVYVETPSDDAAAVDHSNH